MHPITTPPPMARIHTPYSHQAFAIFLEHAGLTSQFPNLPLKIHSGFPLCNDLPQLLHPEIQPNLPSAQQTNIAMSLHSISTRNWLSVASWDCSLNPSLNQQLVSFAPPLFKLSLNLVALASPTSIVAAAIFPSRVKPAAPSTTTLTLMISLRSGTLLQTAQTLWVTISITHSVLLFESSYVPIISQSIPPIPLLLIMINWPLLLFVVLAWLWLWCNWTFILFLFGVQLATEHPWQVRDAPPGAQACTLDVKGAYCMVPVLLEHKWYLVLHFKGRFYLDHDVPFGLQSASGLQGEIADATVNLWRSLGVYPIVKWVDNFVVFRFHSMGSPFSSDGISFDYDLSAIKQAVAPLGIPWHPSKGQDFTPIFSYMGFMWDLPTKTVSLSLEKCLKTMAKLTEFLHRSTGHPGQPRLPFTKKEVQSLNGSLSHISFVHIYGRTHLSSLHAWIWLFKNNFQHCSPPPSVITDVKWWLCTLTPSTFLRSLKARPPIQDFNIWVNASTNWGIGILIDNYWDAVRTIPHWRGNDNERNICWLKAVAVKLVIHLLHTDNITHINILIQSDNQGIISSFNKGWCTNQHINSSIQRAEMIMDFMDISVQFEYMQSEHNLADPVSWDIFPPSNLQLPMLYQLLPLAIRPLFTQSI